MRTMSTPRRKISMSSKQKPLRIAILGQNGVGKSGRNKYNHSEKFAQFQRML